MTAGSVTPEHLGLGSLPAAAAAPAPAAAAENAFFAGNPAALGIPVFVAGSVALALTLIGYVPSITASAAVHTQGLFLITWIVIMGMLTLATLRLPLAFTAVFALVELALIAVLIGTENASKGWLQTGGVIVFLFAAVGVYIYFAVGSAITGGPDLPLGNPVIKS